MYTAEVVADSISPEGHRLTSVKVIYPHAVHKDMLRHRNQNRNVESFRAQPPENLIENLRNGGAFKPDVFAHRTKGMGQGEALAEQEKASSLWDAHVYQVLDIAKRFLKMGIAKQQVNFLLQDLCPLTEIITATDWSNFEALRTELNDDGTPVARPEVYKTAHAIMEAIRGSQPVQMDHEGLHLPFVTDEEYAVLIDAPEQEPLWIKVSAGRCARISFGDYEWWKEDSHKSFHRAEMLLEKGHMSPYEQQAKPFSETRWDLVNQMKGVITKNWQRIPKFERDDILRQLEYSGNMHGWIPVRKMFPYEYDYSLLRKVV
jgi:hypothetical protein